MFDNLKYNLYEILNVPQDASETTIKKSFMKLIKNYHPDKNSEVEEDIYYHIVSANQILMNRESRDKYDAYILNMVNTFLELKEKHNNKINNSSETKMDATLFNKQCQELNNKHGYNDITNKESILLRYNDLKKERDNIKINKEDIKNVDDFNTKFKTYKIDGTFKDQLIEYDSTSEITTYVSKELYTNFNDIDKLYVEDSLQTNEYCSLDSAFKLHHVVNDD